MAHPPLKAPPPLPPATLRARAGTHMWGRLHSVFCLQKVVAVHDAIYDEPIQDCPALGIDFTHRISDLYRSLEAQLGRIRIVSIGDVDVQECPMSTSVFQLLIGKPMKVQIYILPVSTP